VAPRKFEVVSLAFLYEVVGAPPLPGLCGARRADAGAKPAKFTCLLIYVPLEGCGCFFSLTTRPLVCRVLNDPRFTAPLLATSFASTFPVRAARTAPSP
jgi:hypothetical protein